jgi:hypothetical protein
MYILSLKYGMSHCKSGCMYRVLNDPPQNGCQFFQKWALQDNLFYKQRWRVGGGGGHLTRNKFRLRQISIRWTLCCAAQTD